ncbi:MAG: multidrug efflux MFS transporter [Chloroflexi bacterium]|nr:multidrug efflux MFS transporter [Chloroflexota bacterium]
MFGLRRLEYKWIVGIVFVFAIFMDLLDMTIVNVALPTFAKEFHASTTAIEWVVTGYLLSLAVSIPASGWVGDRFGTKRTFTLALVIFTGASLLCSLAWNIESLVGFRILQGVGGGMLTPVGTAMLFRAFPPQERAKASSVLILPTVVAPASGPILGGYLVQYVSWHWIFLINVPIGAVGVVAAATLLREERQPQAGSFDIPGFAFGLTGLATVTYALSRAGSQGFNDSQVAVFGLGGLVLLTIFTWVELRVAHPMINIRLLLNNRLFRATNTVQIFTLAGFSGALFLLPIMLQSERGLSPLHSGLATFPQAIGVVSMSQPASRLYRHIGPRRMMVVGLIGSSLTAFAFSQVGIATNLWWIRALMLCRGWSFALVIIPMQTATFATITHDQQGRASSIFSTGRQVGSSLGVAILGTVLTSRLSHHHAVLGAPATTAGAVKAFQEGFIAASALVALAILIAVLIQDRDAAPTLAPKRQAALGVLPPVAVPQAPVPVQARE